MPQVKIYANENFIQSHRQQISDTIHQCLQQALQVPKNKRFQRFIPLKADNFIYPDNRSEKYIIIELSIFSGRQVETKKELIRLLFKQFEAELGLTPLDLEISILESPQHNWGIRGYPGDELRLDYKVEI